MHTLLLKHVWTNWIETVYKLIFVLTSKWHNFVDTCNCSVVPNMGPDLDIVNVNLYTKCHWYMIIFCEEMKMKLLIHRATDRETESKEHKKPILRVRLTFLNMQNNVLNIQLTCKMHLWCLLSPIFRLSVPLLKKRIINNIWGQLKIIINRKE